MRRSSRAARIAWTAAVAWWVGLAAILAPGPEPLRSASARGHADGPRPAPLARYFPRQDLLVYAEFEGLAHHADAWRRTATHRILAEMPTGRMLESLATQLVGRALSEGRPGPLLRGEELVAIVEHALREGFAFGVVRPPSERKPNLVGVVLRNASDSPIRALIERTTASGPGGASRIERAVRPGGREVRVFSGPSGPGFAWWFEGRDLALGVGPPDGLDLMIAALDGGRPSAVEHPHRVGLLAADPEMTAIGLAFFDMAALPPLPAEALALGFGGVERLDYRWGFEGPALVTRTRIHAPAPRSGLLALLDQPTFSAGDLPALPKGLPGLFVASIDPGRVYDQFAALLPAHRPGQPGRLSEIEDAIRETTGRDLRRDVLGPLGPRMVLYTVPTRINAPTNPFAGFLQGLVRVPRTTLLVELKDPAAFGETLDALVPELNKDLDVVSQQLVLGGPFDVVSPSGMTTEMMKMPVPMDAIPHPVFEPPPATDAPADEPGKPAPEPRAGLERPRRTLARSLSGALPLASTLLQGPDAQETPVARLVKLDGRRTGYVLRVPPSVSPLPAGIRPTVLVGERYLAIGTTPEAASAALDFEGEPGGPPKGDPVGDALTGLPDRMTFLHVSDTRETMLPEFLANLPNLARIVEGQGMSELMFPFSLLAGRGLPNFGRPRDGRPPIQVDPELIPSPDAIRAHLFPASYAMTADDRGFEFVTRESFPALNPAAFAPLALAAAVPALQASRASATRAAATNNLKQIGLAFHNFADAHGQFPSDILAPDGTPLLNWRVQLLPFLEQQALFNELRLDEPWDSPHNAPLLEKMPTVFQVPGAEPPGPGQTFYRAFSGPGAAFEPGRALRFADVTDGTSNTLAVVEAREAVPWTKPGTDLPFDNSAPLRDAPDFRPLLGGHAEGGFHALLLDGSVRFIRDTVHPLVLRALITRDGGEVISSDSF